MENNEQSELTREQVQDFIKGQVETYAKEVLEKYNVDNAVTHPPQKSAEEQARDNLRNIIDPFIKPGLNNLQTEVLDVKDSSQFYSSFDGTDEEKQAIETMFTNLKNQGRPIPRQDIKDYLDGKLAREKPDEYEKRTKEKRERQTSKLNGAGDFGSGSIDRGRANTNPRYTSDDLWKMPMDELEKVMAGVTF